VTKASFDYYHSLFGIRYPFGEYHQVYVPEFNAGAMENPGCVTVRDSRLFRGAVSDDDLLTRARTTAHEMAHMWFGDLVTMRWWDDLWLNESFAEYMASRTLVAATEFTDAWVSFGILRKTWGYAAERAPSTHPVAGSAALDADTALQDFDGISYAKGASVLRQLIAYVGDKAFVAGTSTYLRERAFGNGTLADFPTAVEQASGTDLTAWSRVWLLTADRDRLSIETTVEDGVVTAATLRRAVPPGRPADRPHALDVAGFTDGVEQLRLSVVTTGDVTPLPGLVGRPAPAVLVPNAGDLTWAGVDLRVAEVAVLPSQLAQIPEAGARGVVWAALIDGVSRATLDPRTVLTLMDSAWVGETSSSILERVGDEAVRRLIPRFLPEAEHEPARQRLAAAAPGCSTRPGRSPLPHSWGLRSSQPPPPTRDCSGAGSRGGRCPRGSPGTPTSGGSSWATLVAEDCSPRPSSSARATRTPRCRDAWPPSACEPACLLRAPRHGPGRS